MREPEETLIKKAEDEVHGHKANRLCSFTQGPLLASTLYRPPRPYTPHPPSFSEGNDHIQVSLPSRVKFQPIAPSFLTADPPGITTEQSNDVQRELISLMDRLWTSARDKCSTSAGARNCFRPNRYNCNCHCCRTRRIVDYLD